MHDMHGNKEEANGAKNTRSNYPKCWTILSCLFSEISKLIKTLRTAKDPSMT